MKQKRIVTVLAALCSLVILFIFLAQHTAPQRRQQREERYLSQIRHYSALYNVPAAMVLAVIQTESDFYPRAVSQAGACGLMQLMPTTFVFLQQEKFDERLPSDAIFDPEVNIRYGVYYLSYLYERFDSWQITLAAYNAGEGRVCDWLADPTISNGKQLYSIPFPETKRYVEKVLSAYNVYREKYQNLT